MPTLPHTLPPKDNVQLRRSLYRGELHLFGPTAPSLELADAARAVLVDTLDTQEIRLAHLRYGDEELFQRIGKARRLIYTSMQFGRLCDEAMAAIGFDPRTVAIDPARVRAVIHRGHENPRAHAVYGAHRDTWYGHPASLITWWVPLDDLREEETFCFYPDHFDRPVPNDSESFDYEDWVSKGWSLKIGWQDHDAGLKASYPALQEADGGFDRGREVGFSCGRGDNLLFSGTHLHATRPQAVGDRAF